MSDLTVMYEEVLNILEQHLPRAVYGDIRRVQVLAWATIGLCDSHSVHLPEWATVLEGRATLAASRVRRLSRWLKHPVVQPQRWYAPLLRHALADWDPQQRLYVALDTSVLGAFVLIRAALIYRGRALPIAWRVIRHASASVSYTAYAPVLAQVKALLPNAALVLLADRGFYHADLLTLAATYAWHYRIRVSSDTILTAGGQTYAVRDLYPPPGQATFLHHVSVLDGRHPEVHIALGTPADTPSDPWGIVSDEPTSTATFTEYGLRFDIEENFLDDKSNGFEVEASRLDDPQVLERLFLVLAVATLYFTSVGVGVVRTKVRRWVDTHWDRGMSYLKIGWHWVRQQARRQWPRFTALTLDPDSDPEPVRASRKQGPAPPRQWQVVTIDCKSAAIKLC